MAEIVNLRQVRKSKARTAASEAAEANRARFGRPKAEKRGSAAREELATRRLDAHKRDVPESDA